MSAFLWTPVHVRVHALEQSVEFIPACVSVSACVCVNIHHFWQCYILCHTSRWYYLLWQLYVLLNFHCSWSCAADSSLPKPGHIDRVEVFVQHFSAEVRFSELALVFLGTLLTHLPRPPVCGVRHSPVLCCSLLWHIDWVPFKSPVLPPLFTPIVNLYNVVKDCFTHLDYTISLLQQPDRRVSGNERRGEARRCGLGTSSLPRGRCSAMAPERALALL